MISSSDFKRKIDIPDFKNSIDPGLYDKINSTGFENLATYGYIYQTEIKAEDQSKENYCLSCVVNFTEPTIPNMNFRRLNSHKRKSSKLSKKRSPNSSKKRSPNSSKKRLSNSSKKRLSNSSKKRSPKRSKRASIKKSK